MKLYSYWRSSTAYRVRIALNFKGLAYQTEAIDLTAGAQHSAAYRQIHPGRGVPALVLEDGTVLTQSMAILDWLEEMHPQPPLLPNTPIARAQVRAAALVIATDIHPVNNLKVLDALKALGHSGEERISWMRDWMARGFGAFTALVHPRSPCCFGDAPGLADFCLVPQLYNARRWGLDLQPFARLTEIEAHCLQRPEFIAAAPKNQPDAEKGGGS